MNNKNIDTVEIEEFININYQQYLELTEEQREYYDFLMEYGIVDGERLKVKDYISDKPFEDNSFEFVKDSMRKLSNGNINELLTTILSLPEYAVTIENPKTPAWKIILTTKYIIEKLTQLITMESNMLVSRTPSPYTMQIEQIDFSMFNQEWVQLNDLADGDITKFDTIRKLKYSECFVQLLYRQKQNDLQQLIESSFRK